MKVTVIKSINVEMLELEYPQYGVELAHIDGLNPATVIGEIPHNQSIRIERIRPVEFVNLKTRERHWVGISASAKSDAPLIFETIEDMNKEIDRLRKIKSENVSRPEFKLDLTEWYKLQKRLQNAD